MAKACVWKGWQHWYTEYHCQVCDAKIVINGEDARADIPCQASARTVPIINTCAEWVGWVNWHDGAWRDGDKIRPNNEDLPAILWEACRVQLCRLHEEQWGVTPSPASEVVWWDDYARSYPLLIRKEHVDEMRVILDRRNARWFSPLENIKALAEVLAIKKEACHAESQVQDHRL